MKHELLKSLLADYLRMRQNYADFKADNPAYDWDSANGISNNIIVNGMIGKCQGAAELLNMIALSELKEGRESLYQEIVKLTSAPFA